MFILRCVKTEPEHVEHYYAYDAIEVREDSEPRLIVGLNEAGTEHHRVSEHRSHSQLIYILSSTGARLAVISARPVKATRPEETTRERV